MKVLQKVVVSNPRGGRNFLHGKLLLIELYKNNPVVTKLLNENAPKIVFLLLLEFLGAPVLAKPQTDNIEAVEGSNQVLRCVVIMGNPAPTINWFRDSSPILPRG